MNVLKLFFNDYLGHNADPEEVSEACDFFVTYVGDEMKTLLHLAEATTATAEQAFYAGFRTAVNCLLGEPDSHSLDVKENSNVNTSDNSINDIFQGDNNVLGVSDITKKEIRTILSKLSPRKQTELMMKIYQFYDECEKQSQSKD